MQLYTYTQYQLIQIDLVSKNNNNEIIFHSLNFPTSRKYNR